MNEHVHISIQQTLESLESAPDRADPGQKVERLNQLFRSTLDDVWQSQQQSSPRNRE